MIADGRGIGSNEREVERSSLFAWGGKVSLEYSIRKARLGVISTDAGLSSGLRCSRRILVTAAEYQQIAVKKGTSIKIASVMAALIRPFAFTTAACRGTYAFDRSAEIATTPGIVKNFDRPQRAFSMVLNEANEHIAPDNALRLPALLEPNKARVKVALYFGLAYGRRHEPSNSLYKDCIQLSDTVDR